MSQPVVSVCLITYKQEAYVKEAIEGILKQEQNGFKMEVVVGDDCSPDNTLAILKSYEEKHPELIRICNRDTNLGMHGNWAKTIEECTGKYISIIEGDDRWEDSQKLAKQVALLESNPSGSGCFSNAKVLDENGVFDEYNYVDKLGKDLDETTFFKLNANPIPTCTTLFRRSMFSGFKQSYYQSPFADWILHTSLIQNGSYLYLNECTSAYRKHGEGVWSGIKKERQLLNKLKAIDIIFEMVGNKNKALVKEARKKQLDELLYFYRNEQLTIKYFSTWLKLKLA